MLTVPNKRPYGADDDDAPLLDKVLDKANQLHDKQNLTEHRRKYSQFGICWNCSRFWYVRSKYGREIAVCRRYDQPDQPLSSSDPIVECSEHDDRFALSISTMWAMAKPIEAEEPRKAGFVIEKEEKK